MWCIVVLFSCSHQRAWKMATVFDIWLLDECSLLCVALGGNRNVFP